MIIQIHFGHIQMRGAHCGKDNNDALGREQPPQSSLIPNTVFEPGSHVKLKY